MFGLSDTKWPGQGRKKQREGYEIIWSDESTEERSGVEVIVSPTYAEFVTQSEGILEKSD